MWLDLGGLSWCKNTPPASFLEEKRAGYFCGRFASCVLPDLSEKFAAGFLLAGFAVGQEAFGGGEDGDAHAADDAGDVRVSGINAAPGGADALDAGDCGGAVDVFEGYVEVVLSGFLNLGIIGDVAVVLEDACGVFPDVGPLRAHRGESGGAAVAENGEEIAQWVVGCHVFLVCFLC